MLAAGSLAVVIVLAVLALLAAVFLFSIGSPLLLLGSLFGLGILAIPAGFALLFAFISFWYVVYALLKYFLAPEKEEKQKSGYSLKRIRKSG